MKDFSIEKQSRTRILASRAASALGLFGNSVRGLTPNGTYFGGGFAVTSFFGLFS